MSPARTLDELLIRAAISDVVLRYAAAVDGRDWDTWRTGDQGLFALARERASASA